MSKFKVGDRVRVIKDVDFIATKGLFGTVTATACSQYDVTVTHDAPYADGRSRTERYYYDSCLELVKSPTNEIHITTKGNRVIAVQKQNGKVVKRAEAICAPSDMFDFNTGAQLAYDRLMKPEAPTEDKPEPKYKVGDKVRVTSTGKRYSTYSDWFKENGVEGLRAQYLSTEQYLLHDGDVLSVVAVGRHHRKDVDMFAIKNDKGLFLIGEVGIEPYTEPAPEPEYYSGKVVCVDKGRAIGVTVGKVYAATDGKFKDDNDNLIPSAYTPFESLEDMNRKSGEHSGAKFIEFVEG